MSANKRRFPNARIQNMIDLCIANESMQPTKIQKPKDMPMPPISENKLKNCSTEEHLANTLYARDYSMTTPLFDNFAETKTSYNNIPELTNMNLFALSDPKFRGIEPEKPTCSKQPLISENDPDAVQPEDLREIIELNLTTYIDETDTPQSSSSLLCTINLSPFSSDDSVRDKNYYPSSTDSDDSDKENNVKRRKVTENVSVQKNTLTASATSILAESINCDHSMSNNLQQNTLQQEKSTDDVEVTVSTSSTPSNVVVQEDVPEKEENTSNILQDANLNQQENISTEGGISTSSTATEKSKQRTKFDTSLEERKLQKQTEKRESYRVKQGCGERCYKQCTKHFTEEERKIINDAYWDLSWTERKFFVKTSCSIAIPKRKSTKDSKRLPRRTFYLKKNDSTKVEVCKTFFLSTLGFNKNNDFVLWSSTESNLIDKRGLHLKTPAVDRDILKAHVESFQPLAPHYRREHAPHRRYLPSDVNITEMHKDFCQKYPLQSISYELYRKNLREMNISFAKLGNEECEICVANQLHCKQTSHDPKTDVPVDCEDCQLWTQHHDNYKKARKLYEDHKTLPQDENNVYYTTDLQKVIMLPRLEGFKKILFCPRLTTYNQSFAPVGKISNDHKPLAVLWHDGISGRKQEDIISAYYHFLIQHRNVKHINLWMDNCSAQNKNWLLFSMMIHLVNSSLIAAETITFCYFEPGHTFMSCDQFHHQVEKSMKTKGKIYDFQDFEDSVASANKSRVDVKTMTHNDFFKCSNFVSDRRLQNTNPRVYLKYLVQVCFKRKTFDILYKTDLDEDFETLRFLTDKYLKNPDIFDLVFKTGPKGIEESRKQGLINALTSITPPHKMVFWNDLPVNTESHFQEINTRGILE